MLFRVQIRNIQHISTLDFDTDLSKHGLQCLVGKNGTGKTTLMRAIRNLKFADTFNSTASPYIFQPDSSITYSIGGTKYSYTYNEKVGALDTKTQIPKEEKDKIEVELPIPDGIRFNHFRQLSSIDEELRTQITLKSYTVPEDLIEFFSMVYEARKFADLKEVTMRGRPYYFILKQGDYYIREDYLSSGEYFLIHLFKLIKRKTKLIVIDEIDISLDASAQSKLIRKLREYCAVHDLKLIFTTHSLPLMKTLEADELYYLEEAGGNVSIKPTTYNYVKSLLFGFAGWDKYILTEDDTLVEYLEDLIGQLAEGVNLCKYKIIPIGPANSVVRLMELNRASEFLAATDNVVSILDGDQRDYPHAQGVSVWCTPFESIEKDLFQLAKEGELPVSVGGNDAKSYYKSISGQGYCTGKEIFEFVNQTKPQEVAAFKENLSAYLAL
ncbi:MAG: AAA family ATPase [Halioglobus sp.]